MENVNGSYYIGLGNLPPNIDRTAHEILRGTSNEKHNNDLLKVRKNVDINKEYSSFVMGFIVGCVISLITIIIVYNIIV